MCSVLDTNIVTNNVSIDINVSDMLNSKNKLLDKINNNLSSDTDNVSIGYFKNEELNKQKFEKKYEKRSFRTGDFGYFEDGLLFFANRKDELIKLHGFRIELGEIDKELLSDKMVSESITIPLKRGNDVAKIISFVIGSKSLDIEVLKHNISKNLPYYMIPSDIVVLDKFPYNSNHKIDKNELINIYKSI